MATKIIMDEKDEKLVPLKGVTEHIPYPVSDESIYRWTKYGIRGHRLPAIRIGARFFYRPSDITAFLESLQDDYDDGEAE